jgi:two-component system sensor histidine kinase/response regulator
MQALERIAGLDLALGLRRTGDKPGFYITVLKKFVLAKADEARRIRSCLEAQDFAGAQRLAHTLKSVAATVGATLLESSAQTLESQLRMPEPASDAQIDALLAVVAEHLQRLLQALQALPGFLPPVPVASSHTGIENTVASTESHT